VRAQNGGMVRILAALAMLVVPAGCTPGPSEPPSPYLTAALGADGPGTAPGPGIYPLVPATHAHVQLSCPLIPAVHYDPAAIDPESVAGAYVCTTRPYADAPDGTPQIEEFVDRVADADLPGLLETYAAADAPRTDEPCELSLHDPLVVWLHHGDERITPVYAPQDPCGFPTAEAVATYSGLELHRVLVAREKMKV